MMDILARLKSLKETAQAASRGSALVDFVTLRQVVQEIERLQGLVAARAAPGAISEPLVVEGA